jgi:superfamily II DNA or RNA helicase
MADPFAEHELHRPTPPELRGYQVDIVAKIEAEIEAGRRRILAALPTGAGKTIIACEILRRSIAAGRPGLFLAHRRELIRQSARKLDEAGLEHGLIAPGFAPRPYEPVQVASIAALHGRALRTSRMVLPPANIVLVDEAHHSQARTWRRLIDCFPDAVVLGLTATPARADGAGLGGIFQSLVEGPSIAELIALGFLVPTRVFAPAEPDLDGVRIRHGDYVEGELALRVDQPKLVGDVAEHWLRLADRQRTVVFATGVAHSLHLRDAFSAAGVVAEHLDGGTPTEERDAMLARLAAGTTEVIVNCAVLCEGWDSPAVSCVVLARPTRSLVFYRQMLGRGVRPSPGKSSLLVLDHSGATHMHGLIEEPIVWTLSPELRATRASQAGGGDGSHRKLVTCAECKNVYWAARACPACGRRPMPKPEPFVVVNGDLAEVARNGRGRRLYSDADRRLFHAELCWIAQERGYKHGWAAHKFREKFGGWPPRSEPEPEPPSPATRSWVKSRAIAWAKARRSGAP